MCEFMDSWQRLNERFSLRMKNLGDYHDRYMQSDALPLVDVYKSFHNKCIEIYELYRAYFLSEPELA